jgi:hypothetical protein
MQSLTPEKILAAWEAGRDQHELDRALTLLAAGTPELSRDALASLPIGERDARLLRLRAATFGIRGTGTAACPACLTRVEFPVDTSTFVAAPPELKDTHEIETKHARVRFRLPNSRDLAAVVEARDDAEGLRRILEQCVVELAPAATDVSPGLSPDTLDALSRAMLQADPAAEITLALECPACALRWETGFDVADFFWHELADEARRLLREVDGIARAYGWSEREILALSARRRQTYFELSSA